MARVRRNYRSIDATTTAACYTAATILAPGAYYWRVYGRNDCDRGPWSSVWILTIQVAPSAPALSSPANGSGVCDTTPAFVWHVAAGATSYWLMVDNDSGFRTPEI